ncbi:Chromatin-remodeling ATPase INO80 [Frankliniella fusca]|uniref:Chromatin-remodeling ATPase INO80 n=1 Tax=Frankliniella fusca TaxID=407009 RepID=A0AAE1H0A4_9NEOP|nr:Chromatin-remodeling ATPase INO80 [Frankliniella fusca]
MKNSPPSVSPTKVRSLLDTNPSDIAKPLHLQKLEQTLDVRPFLAEVTKIFEYPASDLDSSESETDGHGSDGVKVNGEKLCNGIPTTKQERKSDKHRLYNFSQVAGEREWLRDVLISDSEDSAEEENWNVDQHIRQMLYYHQLRRKYQKRYYSNPDNLQYQYYGAGLLSNFDKFTEHQKAVIGNRKKKKKEKVEVKKRGRKPNKEKLVNSTFNESDLLHLNEEERNLLRKIKIEDEASTATDSGRAPRGRKKKQQSTKSPEVMAQRRRKIWAVMAKKELGKVQRGKANNHKEQLTSCRRVATYCMRHWRQKAMQSQKNMKETVWRLKRLTREMQAYWKRYDRVERETRRRMEKEAEEQRKMDVELMEAKRQQRKLNFLITQTELYAHFMSKRFGSIASVEQQRILSQLDEEKNPRLLAVDDYDSEAMKSKVKMNVSQAFRAEQQRTRQFAPSSTQAQADSAIENTLAPLEEQPQPAMFKGNLKHYQLKGLSWVANLYDQGINGILADEMGLGKTVQSIAVLCHVAEKYGIWGPFLIISPASTLHNWQQEMARFVPDFKVVPYWGSPQERKILRGFWDQKDMHTKEASFHVVITSYQLVIQDFKYFNRIKWQYMILDEAQAIKSTSSQRWKLLQSFSCRNRLLLSGTPIQNSMAELWALLHFIMPTLFDSHDEFNEWFSKDIESHAENKTAMDEKHLTRLHMILKPFMLRRIKKDVENELSDKIEVMVYCPLTTRQKLLYTALKKKIRIEDLLQTSTGSSQSAQSVTSSLMNLVMQFRKVCNHPELFERREAKSPFFMQCAAYVIPKLVAEYGIIHQTVPSNRHLLYNLLNIFTPEYLHRALYHSPDQQRGDFCESGSFGFMRIVGLSPQELSCIVHCGILAMWKFSWKGQVAADRACHMHEWGVVEDTQLEEWSLQRKPTDLLVSKCSQFAPYFLRTSSVLKSLIFSGVTSSQSTIYTHTDHVYYSIPETVEHRLHRSKKLLSLSGELVSVKAEPMSPTKLSPRSPIGSPSKSPKGSSGHPAMATSTDIGSGKVALLPEFPHVPKPPHTEKCAPTNMPSFLFYTSPKINTRSREIFASSRAAAWKQTEHNNCGNSEAKSAVWHGPPWLAEQTANSKYFFSPPTPGGLLGSAPAFGWSSVLIPDKQTLVTDAGKLYVLDGLLTRLKEQGHRVLIYSQMTKMIDLLEEYMWHRKHTYMRLDGSSKISERRDMVADFQARTDIFVFLLSTRAGGLGINLTAADTVIFYDSDWNPTVDQQAMDRAHRLGQTKQVTVYRLICKGSIEERILQRAREKSEIQRMVISGEQFKPDTLKPKEVVSLLLDDEEIEHKYRQKQRERRQYEEFREREKKRRLAGFPSVDNVSKRPRLEGEDGWVNVDSNPNSPTQSECSFTTSGALDDKVDNLPLMYERPISTMGARRTGRGGRRGRPRGTRRGAGRGRMDGRVAYPRSSCSPIPSDTGGVGTIIGELPNSPAASPGLSVASSPVPSPATASAAAASSPAPAALAEAAAASATASSPAAGGLAPAAPAAPAPPVRRGPGRPRLKPGGKPANTGTRGAGARRPRRPVRPLPVPLGRVSQQPPTQQAQQGGIGFYTQRDLSSQAQD